MNTRHRARKRFGQNFLVDQHIIQQIVSAVALQPGQKLVEIGPGQGALTRSLLSVNPELIALEIDHDLIGILTQTFPGLDIRQTDALQFDFRQLVEPDSANHTLRIVGNLPYNISTPLLFHLLNFGDCIDDMHFMLQKEVVDRLAAVPGQKNYGRLSVMVQYQCQVMPLFTVPPAAFRPAPKVQSAVVRIRPHRTPHYPECDIAYLSKVVNQCFQQRRKTLRNCLKPLINATDSLTSVDLKLRPEQLTIDQFVALTNELFPHDPTHRS